MLGLSEKSYGQDCPQGIIIYGSTTGDIPCYLGTAEYESSINTFNQSFACTGPRIFYLFKDANFTGLPTCNPAFGPPLAISPCTTALSYIFTGLTAGNYVTYITNCSGSYCGQSGNNGCGESKKCFTYAQPPILVIDAVLTNPLLCNNSTNGIINITASGGTITSVNPTIAPGYEVSWTFNGGPQTNPPGVEITSSGGSYSVPNLGSGTYIFTVKDKNNCIKTITLILSAPPPIAIAFTKTNLGCNGLNNGSINITASGGTPFVTGNQYTYSWTGPNSFTSTSEDLNNLAAGNYTVTVTDANNCTKEQEITISEPTPVVGSDVSTTPLSCTGSQDGEVILTVSGGVPPYTLSRSGSASQIISSAGGQATFTGLPAGNLSFFVLDASGCKDTIFVTLTEPPALNIILIDTNVSCYGYQDGRIGVEVSGGTPQTSIPTIGYSISWNPSGNAFIPTPNINDISGVYLITNLTPGSYTVTVIDGNECENSATVVISQPPNILLSTSISQTACFDDSTGAINLTVLPQPATNPPYSFLWSGPGLYSNTTEDISGVPGGIYSVTVSDAFNCQAIFPNLIVPQPPQLTLTSLVSQEICYDPTPGAIDITVNGGTPGYFYSWSGSGIPSTLLGAQDQSNLSAGIYNLTVVDVNGCQILNSWQIELSPPLLTIIETHIDPLCHDDANGSITVTVNGGTPGYTISIDGGAPVVVTTNPHPINPLSPGIHTVTVLDDNDCEEEIQITINNPPAILLGVVATNVPCYGGNNGEIVITASGGTGLLTYTVSTGVLPIFAGPISSGTPVTVTGSGAAPMPAGTYTVTITDANLCTATQTVIIGEPTLLQITGPAITQPLCYGETGAIDIGVTGGAGNYVYLWTGYLGGNAITITPDNTQDISNLAPGDYTVVVTDDNGCTATDTWTINDAPPAIVLTPTITQPLCHNGTGSATIGINGGVAPYTISINGGAQSSVTTNPHSLTSLIPGTYTVTVLDDNDCEEEIQITINNPPAILLGVVATNVPCYGGNNGEIVITASGGTGLLTYTVSTGVLPIFAGPISSGTPVTVTGSGAAPMPAGTYTVTITDANLCTATQTVIIGEPTLLQITGPAITQPLCYGETGAIDIGVTGGAGNYVYLWTGYLGGNAITITPDNTQDISNLAPGDYTVVVTDDNGCTATQTWTINEAPPLLTIIETHIDPLCHDDANGSITVTVNGGTPGYTITGIVPDVIIATGPNSHTYTGLTAGSYTITVTDINGCDSSITILLVNPLDITLSASTTPVSCFGGNDGTITFTASGGTNPFNYWTSPATASGIINPGVSLTIGSPMNPAAVPAGNYKIYVLSANSCLDSIQVTVAEPSPIVISWSDSGPLCDGASLGFINIIPSGGTPNSSPPFYQTQWSWAQLLQEGINCLETVIPNNSLNPSSLTCGVYTVTVTDGNGCTAQYTDSIIITPTPFQANFTGTDILCYNQTNGTITVQPTTGVGPFNVVINSSSGSIDPAGNEIGAVGGTYTVGNLAPGNYGVLITDFNGCTVDSLIIIAAPDNPITATVISPKNVSCFDEGDGAFTVSITGGTAPYTISVTPSGGSAFSIISSGVTTINNLNANTYSIAISDVNNCSSDTVIQTITQPLALTVVGSVVQYPCFGATAGDINITVSGGTMPYAFSWSGPGITTSNSNNEDQINLISGIYNVTVTDDNGCDTDGSWQINPTPPLLTITETHNNPTCYNGATGSITVTVNGGTPIYTITAVDDLTLTISSPIIIPTAPNSHTYTGLTAGSYTITVTDNNGCDSIITILLVNPLDITLIPSTDPVSCFGGNDGIITFTASGGTGTLSYFTTPASSSGPVAGGSPISNLSAGIYTLTITDQNGCQKSITVDVDEPEPFTLTGIPSQVDCYAPNAGAIDITVGGGTPVYNYAWVGPASFTSSSPDLSGLAPGIYTLTVTDDNGCDTSASWQINPPPPLLTITETHIDPLCHDDANGSITVTVNGGTPGYTITAIDDSDVAISGPITIPPGPNSHTYTGLTAGSYTITVTDANGCDSSTTILLVNPLDITLDAITTPVSCNDGNNGTIIFSASGGTGALSYSTVPATTSGPVLPGNNVISNLSAGSYILTITDQNGCDSIITETITEPEPISFDSISSNINCYGENNGVIIISNIIGGTPAYSYLWTGPSITVSTSTITSQSNLAPGLYTFKVTDANGCFKQLSWNITQPFLPITITLSDTTNTTCYDSLNGSISIAATGGIPGYQIEYQRITPSGTLISPVGIEIQLSGGSYIINNLSAGDYEFTVTDANGCSVDSTFSILSPPEFVATVSSNSILCNPPNNTGGIIITTPPGSYPVTYYITSPSSSAPIIGAIINSPHTIPNLPGGTYDIVLTYNSGLCSQNLSTTIEPASPLFFDSSIVNNISCYGENDGDICVYVSGGAAPYTYSWSIPGTSSCQNNLAPGQYTFTVTDANGCSIGNTYTINAPATPLIASADSTAVLCFGEDDGTITVTVSGGSPNYTLTSPTLNPPNAIIALSGGSYIYPNVSSGTHNITVTDANGCDTTFSVTIVSPTSLPSITGLTVQNIECFEDLNTGEIDFNIIGGTAPYTLTWLNSPASCPAPATIITSSVVSVTALCKGSYTLLITDANGCSINNFIINITAPTAPLSVVTSQTNNLCFGNCNGITTAIPSGGMAPYQHSWSNGQTTPTISDLCLGDYYNTITDANGCFIIAQFSITAPAQAMTVTISDTVDVDCFDNATGEIAVSVVGGTPGYNISWLPVPPNPPIGIEIAASGGVYNITGLLAGIYVITITDLNNCEVVINVPITQPAEMTYTISHSNVTCFGANDGSITLDVNGGVVDGSGEYASYIWSSPDVVAPCIIPNNEISPSGLCPGEYTVVVTDWNGCSISTSATIIEPDLLTNTVQQNDVLCFGDNTGSASVFVLGGTPFATGNQYLYSWTGIAGTSTASFVSNNQTINGLGVGQYNVLVTDANGCTSNNVVNIIMSTSALTAAGNSTPVSCFNGTNGTAIITASNGTAPYVVTGITVPFSGNIPISGGAIIKPNLSAGIYNFSITDANLCETILTIVVTEPPLLTASGIVSNQLCFVPLCTGSITTNVIGGTPAVIGDDYIYIWTSTSTSIPVGANPAGLCVGTYTLVVSDMNGCSTAPQLFIITSPTILESNISAVNVTTFGAATGAIDLSVSGGVSPYDYNWEVSFDGGTTWVPTTLPGVQDQNNLPAGLYQVTITDANGCTTSNAVTITQPSSGITATPIIMPVGCFGDLTGGINLGVSGGSGSYSYQWNGPGATMPNTNQDQTGLGAGSYTVIITDNVTNAFATYTYVITQPATALVLGTPVFVLIPNPGNPPCSNQYTITAPAAGGTAPYDYYWYADNVLVFNGPVYNGTAGETLILNVYDANDCLASSPITLPNPFGINVAFNVTGLCNDLLSGVSIGTSISGGLPGYNYLWSPGIVPSGVIPPGQGNLPSLSNIVSGWYNLTITDQCGTTFNTSVFVPPIQPALILNAVASVNAGCTDATGLITVTATNGYVPYDVEWQGIGGTIGSGNPVGTEISSSGGSYSINNLSSGNYAITLTDSYGCSADTTVFIDNIDPVVPNFSISNILCNTTNVTFTNTTAPNTPGLIWDWQFSDGQSSNEENPTLIFSTPGLITVILTATDTTGFASGSNNNGCVFVGLSQTITILEVPNASFIASPQEINGYSGEVTFVNTSINADSYNWNFGDGNFSTLESPIHQFVAGQTEYTVTLTAISINGCTDDTSIIIRLTNPLVFWVPNTITPDNDEHNQDFLPVFPDPGLVKEYKLLIFNRWGEIVFESNDIEVGWDGSYSGQNVQVGTYIWQIEFSDLESTNYIKNGHINVIK